MFLAVLEAIREQQVHQWRRRHGQVTIGVQSQRQALCLARPFHDARRQHRLSGSGGNALPRQARAGKLDAEERRTNSATDEHAKERIRDRFEDMIVELHESTP
jgi:hypothetical protein